MKQINEECKCINVNPFQMENDLHNSWNSQQNSNCSHLCFQKIIYILIQNKLENPNNEIVLLYENIYMSFNTNNIYWIHRLHKIVMNGDT